MRITAFLVPVAKVERQEWDNAFHQWELWLLRPHELQVLIKMQRILTQCIAASPFSVNKELRMTQRIIYQTADGGVAVIVPTEECGLTIEAIAAKDVPQGVPFKIVDATDIPSDRTFRNAWEYQA